MWTQEKLKEAAEEFIAYIYRRHPLLGNLGQLEEAVKAAFIAGAYYVINNIMQKETKE